MKKARFIFITMALVLIAAVVAFAGMVYDNEPRGWKKAHTYFQASPFVFEGATEDSYQTTITITDPTADNTITLPDDSGAVVFSPGGTTTSAADALAIPVTHAIVAKTTGADAEALTLANGENGQVLTIDLATDGGGDGTLTPTTKSGFTSIVFADAGDNATLMYVDDTVGWIILGTAGVAAPPVTVD